MTTHPLMGFPKGGPLVVLHGPVLVDGVEWYLMAPASLGIDIPTGWSPVASRDGDRYLGPARIRCLESPVNAAELSTAFLTDGLPACYGGSDVTFVGDLTCDAEADTFVTGASWLGGGMCRFDVPPSVYGLDPDLKPGRYAVTGHFLDPQARRCRPVDDDGSDESRLSAILHCRRALVATSATPAR